MMPLKTPKEEDGARPNRQSVKSDGLVEKTVDGERYQDEDSAPSNSGRSCSRREVSPVSSSSVSDIENVSDSGNKQLHKEELEQIFGFLTFAEVKSARLVNKHWRQATTTLLRKSSKMINLDYSVSKFIAKMGDGQFPVNRLEVSLHSDFFSSASAYLPGMCAWVKEFTLSVHISKMVLDDMVTFPTDYVYKDLTHFKLQIFQWSHLFKESWERFTDFVRSILEKSPNLREVEVKYNCWGSNHDEKLALCPVIENIFSTSNSVATSKLSYINLELAPLENIDLAKWPTLNLRLRKLRLGVSRYSKTNELLAKFLETQTRTLKDLTLIRKVGRWDTEAPAAKFTFPRLETLEQLHVLCINMYEPEIFADIDYARMFPCLKKLDLYYYHFNWREFLGNSSLEPTNTVEELIFPSKLARHVYLTMNLVIIAGNIFTGLKKLKINAYRVFTEAVYENLPNLEVLTFYTSNSESLTYDDIITGLALDVCMKFRGIMTTTWIKELQSAEGRSMARLQNLKTLKLEPGSLYKRLAISRLSLHVFKKMISLECLDLFDGCAKTAERCCVDEDQKQFLEELRANFLVI